MFVFGVLKKGGCCFRVLIGKRIFVFFFSSWGRPWFSVKGVCVLGGMKCCGATIGFPRGEPNENRLTEKSTNRKTLYYNILYRVAILNIIL